MENSFSKGGNGPERSASPLFGRLRISEQDQAMQTGFNYLVGDPKNYPTRESLVKELGTIRSHKDLSLEAREATASNILEARKSKNKRMARVLR